MGLYRTKPEEVEAIQYTGSMTQPFEGNVPAWVWGALSTGVLSFKGLGVEITYSGLIEAVLPNDWLVLHADGIIRAAEDKVFTQYYTPARKRLSDEPKKAKEVPTATPVATAEIGTVMVSTPQPVDMDDAEELDRILAGLPLAPSTVAAE